MLVPLLSLLITTLIAEGLARVITTAGHAPLSYSAIFDIKYELARNTPSPDIVALGDSIIENGLYPELVQTMLNEAGYPLSVINVGLPANNVEVNIFLLKQTLRQGRRPKLVLFNVTPRMFGKRLNNRVETHLMRSYLGQCEYKPKPGLLPAADCFLSEHLALLRHRGFIKQAFTPFAEKKVKTTNTGEYETSLSGWNPHYNVWSRSEFYKLHVSPIDKPKSKKPQWTLAHVQPLIDFCKQENLPLVLVWLPEHPERLKRYPIYADFDARVARLARENQVGFINMGRSETNIQHYYNTDHLNVIGGIAFSQQLAGLLLSPPYRAFLSASPLAGQPMPKPPGATASL